MEPRLAQFVDEQVKVGRYSSREDIVAVAIKRLQNEAEDDLKFDPSELDAHIAVGDAELRRGEGLTIDEVRAPACQWHDPLTRRAAENVCRSAA